MISDTRQEGGKRGKIVQGEEAGETEEGKVVLLNRNGDIATR